MTEALMKATPDVLARLGVDIAHHFGGGVYAKEARIPAGARLVQHSHPHSHLSVLASGRVTVDASGATEHEGPCCITIPAGMKHSITAVTDAVWYCIHATEDTNPKTVDESVVAAEPIRLIDRGLPVAPLYWALLKHPELWDQHTTRTEDPTSPHHGLSDIWVRYGDEARAKDDAPHASNWYPAAEALDAACGIKRFCLDVMRAVGGTSLGGVLITRIPAGAECKPHTDPGWHAREYEKFAVQITSAPGQRFCFEGHSIETRPGDLFTFDNQRRHWVTNPTAHERITLIVCVRMEN